MTMDRVTDTIAHFIGAFELAGETGRIRAEYDSITLAPPPEDALDALAFTGLRLKPAHPLEGVDPALAYEPLPPGRVGIEAVAGQAAAPPWPMTELARPDAAAPVVRIAAPSDASPSPVPAHEMPAPSSVAALIYMENRLDDADWFGPVEAAMQAQIEALGPLLERLAEQAEALSPLQAPLAALAEGPLLTADWAALTQETVEAAQGLAGGALEAVVFMGEAASGLHLDGVPVDELPDWETLWPAFLREEETTASAEGDEGDAESGGQANATPQDGGGPDIHEAVSGTDFEAGLDRALEGLAPRGPEAEAPETALVTGGNRLVNEVAITSDWLDAPVIVVEGDAHSFDAISQIGIVFDRDSGGAAQEPPSLVHNAAAITQEANPASSQDAGGGQPGGWAIARIEGDLVQVNGLKQYNFANDSDAARIDVASGSMHLGMGENQLANVALLDQFGWQFDMIIVAGDMIEMNMVRQLNLLVDDDSEEIGAGAVDAPAPPKPAPASETGAGQQPSTASARESVANGQIEQAGASAFATTKAVAVQPSPTAAPVAMSSGAGPSSPQAPAQANATAPAESSAEQLDPNTHPAVTATTGQATTTPTSEPEKAAEGVGGTAPATGGSGAETQAGTMSVAAGDGGGKAIAGTASAPANPVAGIPSDESEPVSGSADGAAAAATASETPPAPENLAYNEAQIHKVGLDVAAEVPKALAEASAAIAEGAEAIGQEVLGLDLFDGVDMLKVLLIEGDFTTVNWIDQINILGDSDSVRQLNDALAEMAEAQTVMGANLLANQAAIEDIGVDSQIMAKGETYSDALLHQAGLLEEDLPGEALGPAELASEAVAFLAEGLLETGMAELDAAQAELQANLDAGLAAGTAGQADLMQTMLS